MNKGRIVLSFDVYSRLVGELAERKLLALDIQYTRTNEAVTVSVDGTVYHRDNSGGTHFSDWAQDEFNKELVEIKEILAEAGIFRGMA